MDNPKMNPADPSTWTKDNHPTYARLPDILEFGNRLYLPRNEASYQKWDKGEVRWRGHKRMFLVADVVLDLEAELAETTTEPSAETRRIIDHRTTCMHEALERKRLEADADPDIAAE